MSGNIIYGFINNTDYKNIDYSIYKRIGNSSSKSNLTSEEKALLNKITKKDYAFDLDDIKKRAALAFRKTKHALGIRDLKTIEAFLSDGMFEEYSVYIDLLEKENSLEVYNDIELINIKILGFESDYNIDSIFVAFTSSYSKYRVNARTGKFLGKNEDKEKQPRTFSEIWTFVRRSGAISRDKDGLIEGYCPCCGNEIKTVNQANCDNCGYLFRSGQYDWILANTTQNSEWVYFNNVKVQGVTKYILHDPGFNLQHIEDRATVMFWRRVLACRQAQASFLKEIACDKYCETIAKKLNSNINFKYYDNCEIKSIRVIALDSSSKEEDKVYVEIVWRGIPTFRSGNNNVIVSLLSKFFLKNRYLINIFVLKRKRDVFTDPEIGLCTAVCPKCGAIGNDIQSNKCIFCGNIINDGSGDWVIEDIWKEKDNRMNNVFERIRININKPIISKISKDYFYKKQNTGNTIENNEYETNNDFDSSMPNEVDGEFSRLPPTFLRDNNLNSENEDTKINDSWSKAKNNDAFTNDNTHNKTENAREDKSNSENSKSNDDISNNKNSSNNQDEKPKKDFNEPFAVTLLALPYETSKKISPTDQIKWLIAMMMAGSKGNPNEKEEIMNYAKSENVSLREVNAIIVELKKQKNIVEYLTNTIELPLDYDFMRNVIKVAFADGKITKQELALIRYIARRMDIDEENLKGLLEIEKNIFMQKYNIC